MDPHFRTVKDEVILLTSIVILLMGLGYVYGNEFVENIIFYNKVEKKYGMVYSYELVKRSYSNRKGYRSIVRSMKDTTKIEKFKANIDSKCLVSYPKLNHYGEFGYYSVYQKKVFEDKPTNPQLEYCKNGARLSKKIDYLRHSGAASMREFKTYLSGIISHDNRIISGVIEKKGEKYLFVNALQSENKLWAIKYRNVDDGKKVLIIYDVNSPSLFAIIDWNPTDEDYDYYNTNEGRKPAFKYLLKLDAIASSLSSMEMEEKTDFEE